MAKLSIKRGTTSKILRITVDDSSSTTGAKLIGLTSASGSLTAYYIIEGAATTTVISLVTATVGTWTSSGFKEVDSANAPGLYELHVPNLAIASGNSVVICLKGAANMVPVYLEIELTGVDNQDGVHFGMTGVPNAAAGAVGGLPTVDASNAVKVQNGTAANQISLAAGLVTVGTNNDKTGYTASTVSDKAGYSLASAPPTAAAIATAVWQDTTAGDFTVSGSAGAWISSINTVAAGIAATNIIGTVTAAASATSFTVTLAGQTQVGLNELKGRSAILTASTVANTVGVTGNVSGNTANGAGNSTVITLFGTSPLSATPQVGDTVNFVGTGATS